MKRLFSLLIFILLVSVSSKAQYVFIGFHTGYSRIVEDKVAQTNVVVPGDGPSSSVKQFFQGRAEAIPLNFSLSVGGPVEFGVEYQTWLENPTFYTAIANSNDVAFLETFKQSSVGLFMRGTLGADLEGTSPLQGFLEVGAGRRWGSRETIYSEAYMNTNQDAINITEKLKPSFYASAGAGIGVKLFERMVIEAKAKYFFLDYYEEQLKIDRKNWTTVQGLLGLRVNLTSPSSGSDISLLPWLWCFCH